MRGHQYIFAAGMAGMAGGLGVLCLSDHFSLAGSLILGGVVLCATGEGLGNLAAEDAKRGSKHPGAGAESIDRPRRAASFSDRVKKKRMHHEVQFEHARRPALSGARNLRRQAGRLGGPRT